MNDRFKFRVWAEKLKRYYYEMRLTVDGDLVPSKWLEPNSIPDLGRTVIEQCTGVKDKHGNLIYEGDILRATCTDGKHIDYPVGWWDGAFHLYFVDKSLIAETGTIQFCLRGLVSVKNCCFREIIGNIHEMESENEQ